MTITVQDLVNLITYGAHSLPHEDLPALREALQAESRRLLAGRHYPERRFPLNQLERINAVLAEIEYTLDPCEDTAAVLRSEWCRLANGILSDAERTNAVLA